MQPGDDPPRPSPSSPSAITTPQIDCGVTGTHRGDPRAHPPSGSQSAVYGGPLSGPGPRYCPSIEDKVVRFADRTSHQIFLEPEGLDDDTVYPNGISTSVPDDARTFPAHHPRPRAMSRMLRPGYAIEYDYVDPRELSPSLEIEAAAGALPRRPDQRHHRL